MTPIFSDTQLEKIATTLLPTDAEPGEKVVVLAVDKTGARVAASFKSVPRVNDPHQLTWELKTVAYYNWHKGPGAEGDVILRWR